MMEGLERFVESYIIMHGMHGIARLFAGLLAWSVVNTLLVISLMFRASNAERMLERRKKL